MTTRSGLRHRATTRPGTRTVSIALHGAILTLGDNPRPTGATKLAGTSDLWRARVRIDSRPWRVVYRLDDTQRVVLILCIARRDEGNYRGL